MALAPFNGSHIVASQDFPLDQPLEQGERRCTIGDGDALRAATKEVQHGSFSISQGDSFPPNP
jgi:hypothetical protein